MELGGDDKEHCCRVCGKCFPCGRSLGGHMRSHLPLISSSSEVAKKMRNCGNGSSGGGSISSCSRSLLELGACYGLREKPKKCWRLSEFSAAVPRRAATRRRSRRVASIAAAAAAAAASSSFPSSSSSAASEFEEEEDVAICLMMLSRDSLNKNNLDLKDGGGGGGVGVDPKGSGSRSGCRRIGSKTANSDASDHDTLEEKSREEPNSDPLKQNKKKKKKNLSSCDAEFDQKAKRERFDLDDVRGAASRGELPKKSAGKRTRFECPGCSKPFHSYQALGGHRANQKRINGCCSSKIQSPENIFDTDASFESAPTPTPTPAPTEEVLEKHGGPNKSNGKSNKAREHRCPICDKVFASGQALGGHKRSHLMASSSDRSRIGPINESYAIANTPSRAHDLLDLNLPAPIDEDSSNADADADADADENVEDVEYKSWWIEGSRKHENLVGFI